MSQMCSTDSQVLDWILAELKKVKTGFRASADKLPSGEEYFLRIDRLGSKDLEVGWWILKQLCLQEWEPFAVHKDVGIYYHLRLEVSTE